MKFKQHLSSLIGLSSLGLAHGVMAATFSVTVTVPGISDPWLAGMPDGSTASANDRAPAQSPVLVSGLWFTKGVALVFDATGTVGNAPKSGDFAPEGNLLAITPHGAGAENGIASVTMPFNAFVGVFLGPAQPSLTPAPPSLDFTTQVQRDYLSLRPSLKQVFFIGDGRTTDGQLQQVIPPTGATRLFLGTMDQWSWLDNHGSFSVTVTQTSAIAQTSDSFDAHEDFSPFQGGTRGVWFYQEFDGEAFTDMVFRPEGNSFSSFQPAWGSGSSALPLLFWDSATAEGLVFHPGLAGGGPQPSRHDVALNWVSPSNAFYSIRGFVKGDSRFGIGGDGFQFSVYREQERLLEREIEFNDKTKHGIFLRHVYVEAGQKISFRVFDKGNNEHDVGIFNFVIKAEDTVPRIRVSEVELCWDAEPNVTYRVEFRSALTTNMWLPFDTNCIVGDGSVKCVYDRVPIDQPQKFYRVVTNCVAQP